MLKKSFIKKCKEKGIDIVIDEQGFKPSYMVYVNIPGKITHKRFSSFSEAKNFCSNYFKS